MHPLLFFIGRVSSSKESLLAPSQTWDRSIVKTPFKSVQGAGNGGLLNG
jgi:hypothetical protein